MRRSPTWRASYPRGFTHHPTSTTGSTQGQGSLVQSLGDAAMHEESSRVRFLDARSSIRTQLSRGPSRERGEEARPGPPRDATRGDMLELDEAAALRAPPFHPGYGTQTGWQGACGNSDSWRRAGIGAAAPRRRSVATTRRRRTGRRRRGNLGRLHPERTAAHLLAALESAAAFGPWRPRPLEAIFGLRGAAGYAQSDSSKKKVVNGRQSPPYGRRHASARLCFSRVSG